MNSDDRKVAPRQSEVPLQIDALPIACIVWDPEFRVSSWNPAAERIFGFGSEEILGKSLSSLGVTAENQGRIVLVWKGLLEGSSFERITRENITKAGRRIFCEWTDSPLRSGKGDLIGILSMIQDVTQRREIEERLRDNEDRYRDLVESSEDLLCTHDLNGNILSCNPVPARVLGYDPVTLTRMTIRDILAPEVRGQYEQYIHEIKTQGFSKGVMVVQTRSREKRIWEYKNTLRTEGVPVPIVRGMAHDVTDRRRMERALKDSEERYRRFFEEDLAGAFIAGSDGKILACNPAFARIFGYDSMPEAQQSNLLSLYENEEDGRKLLAQLGQVKRLTSQETVLRHRQGYPLHVIANIAGRFDSSGKMIQLEGYLIDNTEHRRLEAKLRQAERLEAIGQLAGGFAHEFNNILMAIGSYSDLLLMKMPADSPLAADVQEIAKASERAAALTRQLTAFGRKQMLERKIVDLNEIVCEIAPSLRQIIGDAELVITYARGLGRVMVDAEQIKTVITQLAINAGDAMPEGGTLSIAISDTRNQESSPPKDHFVMLEVTDTGHGMNQLTKERIFEPFFTTRDRSKYSGLGLSTAYGIVEQSGGHITVSSEPMKGTTFKIYLPRIDVVTEARSLEGPQPENVEGTETILLVDDGDSVREALSRSLELLGYTVLQAPDGLHALELANGFEGTIHLLLTDVVMPGMGGLELFRTLYGRRKVKALYLSGHNEEEAIRERKLSPKEAFLQKPVPMLTVARKIREMLGPLPNQKK